MNWWLAAAQILMAAGAGAGLTRLIDGLFGRRRDKAETTKVQVEAAGEFTEDVVEWAKSLKTDAADARKEAKEARLEATAARRELTEVHRQMAALADEVEMVTLRLRQWRTAILDPQTTLERLRAMVDADGTQHLNGRG